jgi:hypothetical protein
MGSLKPGATYVYERNEGTVYAREIGADPSTRKEIGYTYDPRTEDGRPLHDHIQDSKLWGQIRQEAKTNITLQKALDRVIMIYKLSKEKYNGS